MEVPKIKQNKKKEKKIKFEKKLDENKDESLETKSSQNNEELFEEKSIQNVHEPISLNKNIEDEIQEAIKDTPSCSKDETIHVPVIDEAIHIPVIDENTQHISVNENVHGDESKEISSDVTNEITQLTIEALNKDINDLEIENDQKDHQQLLQNEQKQQICTDEQPLDNNTLPKQSQTKLLTLTEEKIKKFSINQSKELYKNRKCSAPSKELVEISNEQSKLQPFTESQLSTLYQNEEYEIATTYFIREFIDTELSRNFENKHFLYDLLIKYIQAKQKLIQFDTEINTLIQKCSNDEGKLWKVSETRVTNSGHCSRGHSMSVDQNFTFASFQHPLFQQLITYLSQIKDRLHINYELESFLCHTYKLQIDHSIQCILFECQQIAKLSQESPVQLQDNALPLHLLQEIRMCLSVLFYFQRRNIYEKSFIDDTRNWIEKLVAILLRVASWKDHLFLLHHILRCPGGVSNWATHFIQLPCPKSILSPFSDTYINHIVTTVAIILSPIQRREEFLTEFLAKDMVNESMWIVVDSDGEDEDNETANKCPIRENDIIALLNQIPFGHMFRNLTRVMTKENQDILNLDEITEHYLLKFFAWSSKWIEILGNGIRTYSTGRYRQLIKLLSRFINYTIHYVTELWILFSTHNTLGIRDEALIQRLQIEYDALFLRATKSIYSSQQFGAWQFLAVLPFEILSTSTLWRLFYMLHNDEADIELTPENFDKDDINKRLTSVSLKQNFEQTILKLPDAEIYYLLQTFANMALSRTQQNDWDFIQLATINLLQVGFISTSTRENNSKVVRDLLSNLTVKYPTLISTILKYLHDHVSHMGQLSLYLFKELPLHLWIPTEEDFQLLAQELTNKPIMSFENNLARFILAHLNWDFRDNSNNNEMFLPQQTHLRIAILLVTATTKHYADGMTKGSDVCMIWENWVWKFVLRLRLHIFDQDSRTIYYYFNDPIIVLKNIPEYHQDILPAVKEKQHVATFVTLLTTLWGHSVPLICDHGFILMQNLINSTRYHEVIFSLHLIIPIFLSCEEALWHCDKLKEVIIGLFNADRGYVKMAKNLIIANDPGPIIKQFGNMIQHHLNNYKKYFLENPGKLIIMWLRIITSIEGWNKDSNYIYILDIILRSTFFCSPIITEVFDIFRELLQRQNDSSKTQSTTSSGISSLFSWMSSSATMPTLLLTISENSVWLAYFILELEHIEFEYKTGVWKELLTQIKNNTSTKTNIDNSLKKAAEICKTPFFGSKFLSIYRWAQQALETSMDHPLLILLWQKFFALYFFRNSTIDMDRDLGGVGYKFFDGVINLNYLKKIKKRLQDTSEYFSKKAEEFPPRMEYFISCESLCKTFLLWLEETRLHEPGFKVYSLPSTYLPQKLLMLFEGSNELWLEYVNYEQVNIITNLCSEEWITNCYRNHIPRVVSPIKKCFSQEDHLKHLLNRLKSYDNPQSPPQLTTIKPIIPPLPSNIFLDKRKLLSILQPRVNIVLEFTQNHSMRFSQHTALDCGYGELLPQLYKSETRTIYTKRRCSTNDCNEIININFMNTESKINESVLHEIRSNRSEYEGILKRCFNNFPSDFCNSSVFIWHVNNVLVSEYLKASSNNEHEKIKNIQKVAADYFYYLISVFSDDIKFYSPAQLVFSSSTTQLGKMFITGWDTETTRLINVAIQYPKLLDTLVALLEPPVNGIGFLNGYKFLVEQINSLSPETTFIFLSKFDINKWLNVKKPRLSERSEILSTILEALMALGLKPNEQFNLLHELLRNNLISVFCHEWPEHYGEVLQAVLRTSSTSEQDGGCISVLVWKDLLNTLGYTQLPSQNYVEELRHYATTQTLLKYNELLESAVLLGHHFTQERLTYGLYGLYPRFRPYVEQITTLLAMFGHGLVVSVMHKYPGLLADELLEMIWPALTDMFSPWLTPYWTKSLKDTSAVWIQQLTDGRAAVLPWIYADINHAQKVINAFVNIIRFIVEMLPASNSILNRVWQYYINNFAHVAIKDHILSPIHASLLTLPWERFWPSLQDLEIMLKVVDQYLPTCHIFIGCIAMRIPWVQWLNVIENKDTPLSIIIRTQQCLLPLLVKLSLEPAVQQQSLKYLQTLLSQAFRFHWHQVDTNTYDQLINWYVMSADPKVVLRLNDKSHKLDYLILDVLLASAEYIPSGISGKLGTHAQAKRKIFIRSFTRLLISTANRYKQLVNSEHIKFRTTIVEVLQDMEVILKTNAVNEGNQLIEVSELLEEFLIIADDKNLSLIFNETLTEWLINRTEYSLILHGVLSVLGTVPQCCIATGALLDAALLGYFNLSEAKWEMVIKLLKGRNLWTSRKLLEVMAQNGNILAFHSVMLIRKDDQITSLAELIDWISQIKPDKNIESRLPLIWNDILELIIIDYHKIIETNDEKNIANIVIKLKKLMACLNKIADEKSGWGNSFLGAMRIRNNSTETTNRCRFFCKALALFLNAQITVNHSGVEIIRCCGESLQLQNCNTFAIKSLHQFTQSELKVCVDVIIKQIQDTNNSLHNVQDIITFLCQHLYNERFL